MRSRSWRSAARRRAGTLGSWGALLGVLVGAWVGSACTLTIDPDIACGDGYVDLEAGEECDPGEPDSFINACVGTNRPDGVAACDPLSCTIVNDLEQCAVCGDGRVDESLGEQCDGDELNGRTCPGGVGILQCTTACLFDTSECGLCGNGTLDEGEECDPNLDQLTMGKPNCTDLVSPRGPSQPYTAGQPGTCRSDCRWERTGCSYCGNGRVDRDTPIDFEGNLEVNEWCDGSDFDVNALNKELAGTACSQVDSSFRPIVECADDCLDFLELDLAQPCCIKTGAACPDPDSPVRCCYEVDNPNSTAEPCQVIFDTMGNASDTCR